MSRYMDQELFNFLAINIAWTRRINTGDPSINERAIEEMLATYERSFPQDNFKPDLLRAVDAYQGWLIQSYPSEPEQSAWFELFRRAVQDFEPDGRLKRRRMFNGVWFASAKVQPPDRFKQFMGDVARYFTSLQFGHINQTAPIKREMRWGLIVSLVLALLPALEATRHHRLWMTAAVFVLSLAAMRLADLWALRRKWGRFGRLILNVVLAFSLLGLVVLSAIEVCNPDTFTCKRVVPR